MEYEKLKDNLSNMCYYIDIHKELRWRIDTGIEENPEFKSYAQILKERQELIGQGYGKIINGIFYCSKPNYFQERLIRDVFNQDIKAKEGIEDVNA